MEKTRKLLDKQQGIREQIWKRQDLKSMALYAVDSLCIAIDDGMDSKEAIDKIYRFSHCVVKSICHASHEDWRQELKEYYKKECLT